MDNKEIKEVEQEGIEVLKDEFGNIINLDDNEEFNTMGKGEDEDGNTE